MYQLIHIWGEREIRMGKNAPRKTIVEIEMIMVKFRELVERNAYMVCGGKNRQDNNDFFREYGIGKKEKKEILLSAKTEELSSIEYDDNNGEDIVYKFRLYRKLYDTYRKKENVEIYLKFKIIIRCTGDQLLVISFHKAKRQMKIYKFLDTN